MIPLSPIAERVTELAGAFGGQLLQPADLGYEEARKVTTASWTSGRP